MKSVTRTTGNRTWRGKGCFRLVCFAGTRRDCFANWLSVELGRWPSEFQNFPIAQGRMYAFVPESWRDDPKAEKETHRLAGLAPHNWDAEIPRHRMSVEDRHQFRSRGRGLFPL